jgi:transcription elongation factor GreA-like protein/transcription elongation GreA/GreB family factor
MPFYQAFYCQFLKQSVYFLQIRIKLGNKMSYLDEFQLLLQEEKLANFLRLWEEYCMAEDVDGEELKKILTLIKNSSLAPTFGQFIETALPLWKKMQGQPVADDVLRLILDLQTINSPLLADLATDFLRKKYGKQPNFTQKLRIVGLLTRQKFQGAIANYELLTHMDKGKFVFHTGGWGVGEVIDISLLREHVLLEFEGTAAIKDLSFDNAFRNLIPLPSDHFLARRFGDPDTLEEFGRDDPVGLIHLLLKDLGPKTAQEIKEELAELVIPEKEWSKWWQAARTKLKKDTKIESPQASKDPFILHLEEIPHEFRFKEALKGTEGIDAKILLVYNSTRDFPEILKNTDLKLQIKEILMDGLVADATLPVLSMARKIQVSFLLEDIFPEEFPQAATHLIEPMENLEGVLQLIEIVAFKKRTLTVVREYRNDWIPAFLQLFFVMPQATIRDYIFKELQANPSSKELLRDKIKELLNKMTLYPEVFFWYFQKIINGEDVPYNDHLGACQFLEAFLILLHFVENKPEMRDLVKKIYGQLTAKRYETIRTLIKGASIEYLEEFLLLASKCQSFTKSDLKILQSLAEVVQPALSKKKKREDEQEEKEEIIWTTSEGYQKLQERIQHIGTVETVENAREIEAARALGDLRENAEYKFALERRSRLQAELRTLSQQLNKARILTKNDIEMNSVGVGSIVHLRDSKGNQIKYTLLGPWDADPDQHILSFQSKLAQMMLGCKEGDTFDFQGEQFTIQQIESYL